ncbi:MAG: hypothetical protein K5695_09610 [Oscillospiraceae bacterium]|nr:hypothetical protein [Oscillospiraceae bacterium]
MISNAFISSALSVIRAQQITAIITVVSNVLPAVIETASNQGSTENNGDETAPTEPTEADKAQG